MNYTQREFNQVKDLWNQSLTIMEICDQTGLPFSVVRSILIDIEEAKHLEVA